MPARLEAVESALIIANDEIERMNREMNQPGHKSVYRRIALAAEDSLAAANEEIEDLKRQLAAVLCSSDCSQ